MGRLTAVLAVLCGAVLIAIPPAYSMFDRTADAERILDRFTFLTLDDNPERYLAEAEVTRDGSSMLVADAIPGLAADAGITEADLAERYPAFAAAELEVPTAHEFSVRYSQQLDAVEDKFKPVYDIPVAALPLTATPWLFLAAGLGCVLLGLLALRGATGSHAAMLALGVALIAGPVAFGALGKASDGEDVKDFAENGLSEKAAAAAQAGSASLDALVLETEGEILPDLAAARGLSEAELVEELEARYPAAGRLLEEWPVIGPRLARLSDAVAASVSEFESAKKLPIAFPVWLLMGLGAVIALSGGLALVRDRDSARGQG